jgi:L-fuculose-phosphate aldolase
MWDSEKKLVLETKRKLVSRGLVVGNAGNVSLRVVNSPTTQLLAITPSGRYCDSLNSDDMVIVDFEGKNVEGQLKPSMETMLHIEIYKTRKDVNAIIHAHPVYGSVLAVAGKEIPGILDDQIICLGGDIKVAEYAVAGTQQLVENVVRSLGDKNAVIMANHGCVTVGKDMTEAFTNCEILEKTSRIYVHALSLGEVNLVPLNPGN